jgi:hypothetical protein
MVERDAMIMWVSAASNPHFSAIRLSIPSLIDIITSECSFLNPIINGRLNGGGSVVFGKILSEADIFIGMIVIVIVQRDSGMMLPELDGQDDTGVMNQRGSLREFEVMIMEITPNI